jgi:hypothetical protein
VSPRLRTGRPEVGQSRPPASPGRREFLQLALASTGALLLAPGCGEKRDERLVALEAAGHPEIDPLRLPPTRVAPREIVASYFGESNLAAAALLGAFRRSAFADAKVLQSADFESLRLANLRGWQLARTEADLCVLAEQVARSR